MDTDVRVWQGADNHFVVRAAGEIDLASVAAFESALATCTNASRVVVDLTAVSFMDSSALAALVEARRRCELSVVGASRIVRRVFELTGLAALLAEDAQS